jgi:hypothetical protein
LLLLSGVGLLVSIAVAEQPARIDSRRDWKKCPAVAELTTDQDIYALGDVHGDYERLVALLQAAGLIQDDPARPDRIEWKGGKAVLVCTGDMIDKGDQSVQVLIALRALRASASKSGGQFIPLMGNHEAEFIASGGQSKKAAEFIKELRAREIDPAAVAQGRDSLGLGEFLRSLPFAARVNDWFFAHAGNTQGKASKKLQQDLEENVDSKGYKADVLLAADGLLESRLHPAPWWEKEGDKPDAAQERLAEYLRALGARHLVLGHQPGKVTFADQTTRPSGEIFQKYDGLVFLIDVGMSRAVGYGTGAILHISAGKHDRATALFADGSKRELWPRP